VRVALLGTAALSTAIAGIAIAQPRAAGGGTVTYWMSAETVSGLSAMNQGGQGRSGMMGLLGGGRAAAAGPNYMHNLRLELGSPRRPSGSPMAEHLPPQTLNAGPSLPLVTPQSRPMPVTTPPNMGNGDGGASGRMLIYWGCGERARGGPIEIDLARLSQGRGAPGMGGFTFQPMMPPSATGSATLGEWPNERSRVQIPANGSLVGDHVIRGNYSPEIRFALQQGQDFLAPIAITGNTRSASGAVPVAWRSVPNARAYFVMASGARADGTIVIWSSSEVQLAQAYFDYLSEGEIARLLQARVLLNPQTTQCTVPAEVGSAVQTASLMVSAFGPEANFSHPARPAGAPRGWSPEWVMKLRTRSAYVGMLGMDMEAMMRGSQTSQGEPQQPSQPRRRRNPLERLLGQ